MNIITAIFGMPIIVNGKHYGRVSTSDGFTITMFDSYILVQQDIFSTVVFHTNISCMIVDGIEDTPVKVKHGKAKA